MGPFRRFRAPLEKFEARDRRRPARSTLVVLLLASATVITLDYRGGADSPLEPARAAVGTALGPVEEGASAAVRPFAAIPSWFHTHTALRREVRDLEGENAHLRARLATADLDRNRLAEYDGLARAASDTGQALVPARVVGYGPSQSFSRTVTIDAGSESGITADMTVVNDAGLVGRVLRTTRGTATVLLILDADSVVGGRVGRTMEVGFLHGRGGLGDASSLDLDLVDDHVVPGQGDIVVTWGSEGGAPYISGVPIGTVTALTSSPRETSQTAEIEPFVDFSALDVVGVVVPHGTMSDRGLIEAAR